MPNPLAPDLLTKIRGEIEDRLRRLAPLREEYELLIDAAGKLELETGPAAPAAPAAAPSPAPAPRSPRAQRSARSPARARPRTKTRGAGSDATAPVSRKPDRAPRGAAQQAIVAALEHGSHTVGELAVVTAMSGTSIRENLRRLATAGVVARTKREGDGKAAYGLLSAPSPASARG